MATSPDVVRRVLLRITRAAQREVRVVSQQAPQEPLGWRAALFATVPLVVSEYAPAASSLALDWFEEIRFDASPSVPYTPTPRLTIADEDVAAMLASVTEDFRQPTLDLTEEFDRIAAETAARIEAEVQKEVASGFWNTVTGNVVDDAAAVGWQRFTRDGACKFCLMLAGRGAVYTRESARFAAHTNCHCVVGPSYDPDAPRASVEQYQASARKRTAKERAALRKYLNANFPDAPG